MIKFYSAWFCPYAQRAWLTLEHHNIPYEYVESLTVKENQKEGDHGYTKNARLLELNPKGLVPTLEFPPEIDLPNDLPYEDKLTKIGNSRVLTESIECIDFLNAMARSKANSLGDDSDKHNDRDLIPDPSLLSKAHEFNQNICSNFYKILMKPSLEEQKEAFESFSRSISEFLNDVSQDHGFYTQSAHPTIVDITVIPWILRIPLLKHYRPNFDISECVGKDVSEKLDAYIKRVENLDSVKKTLWKSQEDLIRVYKRYADGTATSQVGQAVRHGKNAHDV